MSAIYARLVEAAREGRLNVAFEEMITVIEHALRAGKDEEYLHPVASDADGLHLQARLKEEGVNASLEATHLKIDLKAIVNDSKADAASTVVLASSEKNMTTRIRLDVSNVPCDNRAKVLEFAKKYDVDAAIVESGIIEFVLDGLNDGKTHTFRHCASRPFTTISREYTFIGTDDDSEYNSPLRAALGRYMKTWRACDMLYLSFVQ